MNQKKNQKLTIGVLGVGKMGEALIKGLKKKQNAGIYNLISSTRKIENAKQVSKNFKIECVTDNKLLAKKSDIIILCIKPHQAESVLNEIKSTLNKTKLIISTCASITNNELKTWISSKCSVIRSMPNTPCLINEGMTVLSPSPSISQSELKTAEEIFESVGRVAIVEEHLMDGVTGLSGCGPAYVYLMIEALSEAGVKVGLSRKISTLLAAQTLMGSAKMVLTQDIHPAALKDEVTTPAGCTIDGLMALEEGKVRIGLIKAVIAATNRSKSLK